MIEKMNKISAHVQCVRSFLFLSCDIYIYIYRHMEFISATFRSKERPLKSRDQRSLFLCFTLFFNSTRSLRRSFSSFSPVQASSTIANSSYTLTNYFHLWLLEFRQIMQQYLFSLCIVNIIHVWVFSSFALSLSLC